jgi:hypothetical protein
VTIYYVLAFLDGKLGECFEFCEEDIVYPDLIIEGEDEGVTVWADC